MEWGEAGVEVDVKLVEPKKLKKSRNWVICQYWSGANIAIELYVFMMMMAECYKTTKSTFILHLHIQS